MRKVVKFLTSRILWVIMVILVQISWLIYALLVLSGRYYMYITAVSSIIAILLVICIVKQWNNPAYKLAWSIVILGVPMVGSLLYLLFGRKNLVKRSQEKHDRINEKILPLVKQDNSIMEELKGMDRAAEKTACYINRFTKYPVFKNCDTQYFSVGEEYFSKLCEELEKARHFIFMEYFIISRGYMWNTILEILERKASEGVEVRLLYDDMGCIWLLPMGYEKKLAERGIQCRCFNQIYPVLSAIMNNRDHRKIAVIDGCVGFTGGINLADEYINREIRFGHWKDGGVMIRGEAVWNMSAMFLDMWNSIKFTDKVFDRYLPYAYNKEVSEAEGYVQPFGDTPFDHECVAENVYLNLINGAKKYIYFYTPYLIIDNELMTAFTLAAKSGIDVRIITPHIPDKKMVFILTRSYYEQLLAAGVRIYEYEPGFLHSKCCISDDTMAVVGSINLDFRSLYLHFECGTFLYKTAAVCQLKADFDRTLEKTIEITEEFCKSRPWYEKVFQSVLRLVAPLL